MTALLLVLLLGADAGDLEEEKAQLAERLAAEKAAFDALDDEKRSVLTLLDTLERLSRDSAQRSAALERVVQRVARQVAAARREDALVQAALAEQQRRLAPRLVGLYRLKKQDALGFLLASGDFAAMVKRQRALETLVASDARALEDLQHLAAWAHRQALRLELLEATARRSVKALRGEQAVGRARLSRFKDLLASLGAEQGRRSRIIADLEQSEKELAALVAELQAAGGGGGFRARRGQLPFPTRGLVEVPFGKVVNPRFNTVTVQKGLDLRAAEGTPVASVGTGAVVFAGWLKGYGNLVIVDHGDGYHSLYAHLASMEVEVGNEVEEGETIAAVGDTGSLKGAYLYFEIRKAGQAVDPLPWLLPEE